MYWERYCEKHTVWIGLALFCNVTLVFDKTVVAKNATTSSVDQLYRIAHTVGRTLLKINSTGIFNLAVWRHHSTIVVQSVSGVRSSKKWRRVVWYTGTIVFEESCCHLLRIEEIRDCPEIVSIHVPDYTVAVININDHYPIQWPRIWVYHYQTDSILSHKVTHYLRFCLGCADGSRYVEIYFFHSIISLV